MAATQPHQTDVELLTGPLSSSEVAQTQAQAQAQAQEVEEHGHVTLLLRDQLRSDGTAAGVVGTAVIPSHVAEGWKGSLLVQCVRRCINSPHPAFLYLSVCFIQSLFGTGAVLAKVGLQENLNPFVFAWCRSMCSGPALLAVAWFVEGYKLQLKDIRNFLLPGTYMFFNQGLYITGLSLSSPTFASAWQPAQPVLTSIIAFLMHRETFNPVKLLGIAIASASASFMVLFGAHASTMYLASVCLFVNCTASAMYFISTKAMMDTYPPMTLLACAYLVSSVEMSITVAVLANDPADWIMTPESIMVLAYWVVMLSMVCFVVLMWANHHGESSVIASFATVQPMATATLSFFVFGTEPEWRDLGSIGIIIGMLLVIWSKRVPK